MKAPLSNDAIDWLAIALSGQQAVWNIGQLPPNAITRLNAAARKGALRKTKAPWCGFAQKTVWHAPSYPFPDTPAVLLAVAIARCTDFWQRTVIAEWGRRHPKGAATLPGSVPIPCNCTRCRGPAVIFPGETRDFPENQGYCICPRCSVPNQQTVFAAS